MESFKKFTVLHDKHNNSLQMSSDNMEKIKLILLQFGSVDIWKLPECSVGNSYITHKKARAL